MTIAQRALLFLVRCYQVTLSPILAAALGPSAHCRFQPTCSRYAMEAVRVHGAIIGSWLALKRLARCHPWGKCGADPVPAKLDRTAKFKLSHWGHCHHGS